MFLESVGHTLFLSKDLIDRHPHIKGEEKKKIFQKPDTPHTPLENFGPVSTGRWNNPRGNIIASALTDRI